MRLVPYLVQIDVKDYFAQYHPELGQNTFVTIEEVLAAEDNMADAKEKGFEQFANRCLFEPVLRRKMRDRGLTCDKCYAKEAITV